MSAREDDWTRWLPAEAVAAIDRWWKPLWDQIRLLPAQQPTPGELEFEAVEEPKPGERWRERFEDMWPAYQAWYLQEGDAARPSYAACRRTLEEHMPELMPVYEKLVELAGGGDLAARLRPSAALRDVLVLDTDPGRVALAVPQVPALYGEYVRQATAFLAERR